jgi:hypothetical protein
MGKRGWGIAAVAAVVLTGCGQAEDEPAAASTSPSSSAAATSTASSSPGSEFELSVSICTEGIAEPDATVLAAANAAHDGTRSVEEVAASFREAQDAVDDLAAQAVDAGYERLGPALQTYADTLGRARVVGDVGLDEITDARQAIDVACYLP